MIFCLVLSRGRQKSKQISKKLFFNIELSKKSIDIIENNSIMTLADGFTKTGTGGHTNEKGK